MPAKSYYKNTKSNQQQVGDVMTTKNVETTASGLLQEFVREPDLARELRVAPRALRRIFGQHGPKRIRIGKKCIMYRRDEVLAWLKNQAMGGAA